MKIAIIGAGNMGSAIAKGLALGNIFATKDIYVIDRTPAKVDVIKAIDPEINALENDYEIVRSADVVVLAIKPWMMEAFLAEHSSKINSEQVVVSIAAGISLSQLESWIEVGTPIFRVMPNTAIAVKQSMTFIASSNANQKQIETIVNIFSELGKTEQIDESLFPAATSLASCGIAFAFRYIRAAMQGGIEMGLYPNMSKESVLQTLRGAIALLEENGSHPEVEIDKVTTAGGVTIKGLNEMEEAGFSSSVIRGLRASCLKYN